MLLKNGVATNYGFGVFVAMRNGHHLLIHDGEVSGFTGTNNIYPDDRAAVIVLTNQDAASTSGTIADAITPLLFPDTDTGTKAATERAKQIFVGLQQGKLDHAQFTDNANFYFSEEALQ